MKSVELIPSSLRGEVNIPSSKSICHRALIAAALTEGISTINNIYLSDDIKATLQGLEALGAKVLGYDRKNDFFIDNLIIKGAMPPLSGSRRIDCKESASTLRFLIPIAAIIDEEFTFTGKGRLKDRPLDVYYRIFDTQKIMYKNDNSKLPLTINGKLKSGEYHIRGDISSQFITGLLFALPLLKNDSKIILTSNLESKGYVDLTLEVLKDFSIEIENKEYNEFHIKGNQKYMPSEYFIEGDYSQAAFWLAAGSLGDEIICKGLKETSQQGDRQILKIIKEMGGNIFKNGDRIATNRSITKGIEVNASQIPDLVPIIAVLGCLSKGEMEITNAGRLRLKESDRLKAVCTEMGKLGAKIREMNDGLHIEGVEQLKGGRVNSWNDHRIAMALAVASIKSSHPVTIENSDSVSKSYPNFWQDFKLLGGNIYGSNLG